MRAPPEHDTMMAGCRRASASSSARVIFSPATTPRLPPMNGVLHRRHHDLESVQAAGGDDHGILEPGALPRFTEAIPIGLGVHELQRIGRGQVREVLFVLTVIEERGQALGGADPEVMRAFRADVEAGFKVLVVDQLGAARTLDPEALGNAAWFFGRRRGDGLPGLLEPSHSRGINAIQNAKVKMHEEASRRKALCILHFAFCTTNSSGARDVVLRPPAHGVDLTDQIVEGVVAASEIEL